LIWKLNFSINIKEGFKDAEYKEKQVSNEEIAHQQRRSDQKQVQKDNVEDCGKEIPHRRAGS
jgi:hypothetical protein